MKRYLLFVAHSYAYSILRPIQDEIWSRGDDVAWFIEDSSPVYLRENEKQLTTIKEVMEYNPTAVFVPGNYVYDFFPGIKVEVFHGLYYKRTDYGDHYRIRGFFDLYCVTSSMFMPKFEELENQLKFFKVVHTGWSKLDYLKPLSPKPASERRVILYAPTFTKKLNSADILYDKIEELIKTRNWKWIFSFHPKMDKETIDKYKQLSATYENAVFSETEDKLALFKEADMMLSDTSSVIYEFLWLRKPAVTLRNTFPANHLINIEEPSMLENAIETAMSYPDQLMNNIDSFMNKVHPFKDGKSSARILDAVDYFDKNYKGKIKKKPLNLLRKLKLRKKVHYFPFGPRYSLNR
ncbi:CDP-glycerol--poly(glycerophosphate) glycerophosphotransferase [Dysgonomonas sp. 216]|uniref:CDP-glycerol glycerophosphotransferase family protein n=1 Tax=Dysgonomonas sp. 216 TaxID=2302934 RepID=UPI0013CFAC8E|nr:CDP-glycerol glycerophosphotransferase family protein [Dysgonomonas sp. 216]NDW18184.1 CDP-glycerol--poly(glycerophosphate) glycerophosphotransferase [Dysgonomonas sp. 216]